MILTSDLHLTSEPENEYRWQIFDRLSEAIAKYRQKRVFIPGDLTDRKDRHSSALVNRLIESLRALNVRVDIIMGNHDKPLSGVPYWCWLNEVPNVHFYTKPTALDDLIALPYTADPEREWSKIPFSIYRAVIMHQTVTGASDNGSPLTGITMPIMPRKIKVYSGDIHTPQRVRNVEYVGAPHHVKFGDCYRCRMLILNEDYEIARDITLTPPSKLLLEVRSVAELSGRSGDQARVRFHMPISKIGQWPAERAAIADWAKRTGVTLASIESIVEYGEQTAPEPREADETRAASSDNERETLDAFCAAEGIDGDVYETGKRLLAEEIGE